MDHREAGRYWERNAETWTRLSREGWDVYRDWVNTPAFFEMLPDVRGLRVLDIGCGEGHNTRLLAERGARVAAIDIAPTFLRHAFEADRKGRYALASGQELPFRDTSFDAATAFMSLMDMPDPDRVFAEAHRVLRPEGFFQFSIVHPCFSPPHRRLLRDQNRVAYAVEVGRYFERINGERIDRWSFSAAPPECRIGVQPFEVPIYHRTLSEWLNSAIAAGFVIERLAEPRASAEVSEAVPAVADTNVVAYFLHVRLRR